MTVPPSDPTPPGPELPAPPPTPPPDPWATWKGKPQYAVGPMPRQPHLMDERPSRTMAGWALGLAIVPCCFGLTTLVGIGLAITVLVKSRHGVDHGKGLAIGALVVGAVWIVVNIVAFAAGVYGGLIDDADRDADGQVSGKDQMSALKIRAGDCFDYPDLFGVAGSDENVAATTVTAIPCEQAHQFEAYKVFTIPGDSYPGLDRVKELAATGCMPDFKTFVGKAYGRSELEPYVLYPQANSWRLMDDHDVTCIVGMPGETTTGTLEHSRR